MNSRLVEWICPFPSTDLSVFPFLVGVEAFRFRFGLCTDFFFPFPFCLQTFPLSFADKNWYSTHLQVCIILYMLIFFMRRKQRNSFCVVVQLCSFQLSFGSLAMIHPQEIEEVKSELKTAENDMELRQNEQGTSRMQENAWKMHQDTMERYGKQAASFELDCGVYLSLSFYFVIPALQIVTLAGLFKVRRDSQGPEAYPRVWKPWDAALVWGWSSI